MVNNGVVCLDYEDSHHHGPLLCSFQLLYWICRYCLMMYDVLFSLPFCWCPCMAINVSVHPGSSVGTS